MLYGKNEFYLQGILQYCLNPKYALENLLHIEIASI